MTFFPDTTLTEATGLVRRLVLAWVLSGPLIGSAALDTPQRPATALPTRTIPTNAPERHRKAEVDRGPRTYLAMVGPSAIRFAEADPVLPAEPSLPTPQKPKVPLPPEAMVPTPGGHHESDTNKADTNKTSDLPPESANDNLKPVPILPDDTRTEIKPEDVLPFFQFPNGSDSTAVALPLTVPQQPAANTVPTSTATYRQQ